MTSIGGEYRRGASLAKVPVRTLSPRRVPGPLPSTSSEPFGRDYSQLYDLFYADKNYARECDFIVQVIRRFGPSNSRRILDVSCGTGGHAIALASRGFEVEAYDISRGMLAIARSKANGRNLRVRFAQVDMRELRPSRRFDACISMFDSVNYLTSLEELRRVLHNLHGCLRRGGVLILQAWNGGAVLRKGVHRRHRSYSRGELEVVRFTEAKLDSTGQKCQIDYSVRVRRKGHAPRVFRERHRLFVFTFAEVEHLLERSGFVVEGVFPPSRMNRRLSENDWSMVIVGRRGD